MPVTLDPPSYPFDISLKKPPTLLDDQLLVVVQRRDMIGLVEPEQSDVVGADHLHDLHGVDGRHDVVFARLNDQRRAFEVVQQVSRQRDQQSHFAQARYGNFGIGELDDALRLDV